MAGTEAPVETGSGHKPGRSAKMRLLFTGLMLLAGMQLVAQTPEITFDSAANLLKYPDSVTIGEVAGVATNSKGDLFVYARTGHPTISLGTSRPFAHGGSRLYEFDRTGRFLR